MLCGTYITLGTLVVVVNGLSVVSPDMKKFIKACPFIEVAPCYDLISQLGLPEIDETVTTMFYDAHVLFTMPTLLGLR